MNTRNQREIDAVLDVEETTAGFSTEAVDTAEQGNILAARRRQAQQAAAADAPQFIPPTLGNMPTPAGLLSDDRVEPTLTQEPVVEAPATDTAVATLSDYLADCWNQENIDEAAYKAVKHLEIVAEPSETSPLTLRDPRSNDIVQVGTDANTGKQVVTGKGNITPAQALTRARLAMTSDLMRTQGIDQVYGTELDQALLLLAAQDVGLKINNIPTISTEIMDEARQQWATMIALAAVGVGASTDEALQVAETLTPDAPGTVPEIDLSQATLDDGAEWREALKDTTAPAADDFPATQPMSYADEVETATEADVPVPGVHEATVAATETAAAPVANGQETVQDIIAEQTTPAAAKAPAPPAAGTELPVLKEVVPASELLAPAAPQTVVLPASETPDPAAIAAAPVVEVPPAPVAETVAEAAPAERDPSLELRPEVLAVLGDESRLSKAAYLDIRQRMKAPKSSLFSEDGFVSLGSIRSVFRAAGKTDGSTAMAMTALQALEADGVIYKTTAPTTVYRATVNTHAKSDVPHPPRIMPQ